MDLTSIDHLLTTTRSVRKRLDFSRPVDPSVIARCLEIAMQAPSGGNQRGLGTAWTTLHLFFERDAAALLGIPETITQVALFPVAHFTGTDFKPAKRLPAASRLHWDAWGTRRGT